jgi:hypothetical protein
VPYSCSDVRVTLSNCLYYDECPLTYAYPELLVSRLDEMPAVRCAVALYVFAINSGNRFIRTHGSLHKLKEDTSRSIILITSILLVITLSPSTDGALRTR